MDSLERDRLIDYLLGRLNRAAAEALERRVGGDAELARALEDARAELNAREGRSLWRPDFGRGFWDRLRRGSSSRAISSNKGSSNEDSSDKDSSSKDSSKESDSSRVGLSDSRANEACSRPRVGKRFAFVPKMVVAPTREDRSGLVFKRAKVLSASELAARRENYRRLFPAALEKPATPASKGGAVFGRRREDLQLVFAISDVNYRSTIVGRLSRCDSPITFDAPSLIEGSENLSIRRRRFDQDALLVSGATRGRDSRSFAASSRSSGAWSLATRSGESAELDLSQRGSFGTVSQLSTSEPLSLGEPNVFLDGARFSMAPVSFADGRTSYAPEPRLVESAADASALEALSESATERGAEPVVAALEPESALEVAREASEPVVASVEPESALEVAREASEVAPEVRESAEPELVEAVEETPLAEAPTEASTESFGISTRPASVGYSVEPDEEDREFGPTLSAENRYLAELLGRELTPFDLDEFYWEDLDEEEKRPPSAISKFLYGAMLVATEPPVLVGRATIGLFRSVFPNGLYRAEDVERATKKRKQGGGRVSDMMISMVAGVLIAISFVFPAIKYVANEIYTTVAESRVRKLGGSVSLSPREVEEAMTPMYEGLDRVFHPEYDPSQLGVGSSGE
ncbi:MAG: hypothetical protein IJM30_09100 [Thermoguttaceae bacterium]|nr:hypothetical protein [Thermoguttaceae bacterium]